MAVFLARYRYGMEQSERPAQHVADRAAADVPFFSKLNAYACSVAADDSQEVAAGYPSIGHFVNGFLLPLSLRGAVDCTSRTSTHFLAHHPLR